MSTAKKIKKAICLMFAFMFMLSCFSSLGSIKASASKSGYGETSIVVQVWTNKSGSAPYIVLKPQKGTYYYYKWNGRYTTKSSYGCYTVNVKAISTIAGGRTSSSSFTKQLYNKNLKLFLKKNTYYEIVITYNLWRSEDKVFGVLTSFNPSRSHGWRNSCGWYVSKANNCGNYC